jgi:tRNA threonylcarbamoyladenosine biosynthesis protein TsaE
VIATDKVQVLVTHSADETGKWAEEFARTLTVPATVALVGELGAGKTVIAKGIGRGLGVKETVISPTFNYVLEYQGRVPLFHADLYRIESEDIFLGMGLDEYFDCEGVYLIEWAERVRHLLPQNTIWIELVPGDGNNERRIKVTGSLP